MTMKQYLLAFLLALPTVCLFTACGGGDDKMSEEIDEHLPKPDDPPMVDDWTITEIDATDFYCNGLKYSSRYGDYLTVIGIDKDHFKGKAHIASHLEYRGVGYDVTCFALVAFNRDKELTELTIPATVTSWILGPGTEGEWRHTHFENTLSSIVVDENNPTWDSRDNCNAIIETASNKLLFGCKNTVIPNTVKSIRTYAFANCEMSSLFIPASVREIEERAFDSYDLLSSIVVDEGNPSYDSRNACDAIIEKYTDKLLYGCKNTLIPNTVRSIASEAFIYCRALKSITIPASVQSIEENAFYFCDNLTEVTIRSKSLVESNKTQHTSFAYNFGQQVFTYILPDDVKAIGDYTFWGCGVRGEMGDLEGIDIPNSVTRIGKWAFRRCYLPSVTLPSSLTEIDEYAFAENNFTEITIPNGVSDIGGYAFMTCRNLRSIYCKNPYPCSCHFGAFDSDTYNNATLYVPKGSLKKYQEAWEGWREFKNIVEY